MDVHMHGDYIPASKRPIASLRPFKNPFASHTLNPKHGRGERGKMGHVPYGTNTITKKVINVCQYKNRVYSDHHNDDGDEFF